MSLLITGARTVDGSHRDLYIVDGILRDPAEAGAGVERIDADGLMALPGLVDIHVHLREPGQEDAETIETGTRAAARGGFTSVSAMPNTTPITSTVEAAQWMQQRARETASCHVEVIGSVTQELTGGAMADIAAMHEQAGITTFSNDGFCVMDAQMMREALDVVARFDGVIAQHSQDHNLAPADACVHESQYSEQLGLRGWPAQAESAIVARDCELAELTGARVHACHISTAETVEVIRWAKSRGVRVTTEATPHHLLLTTPEVLSGDTRFKVNPPLRLDEDVEAIREALADGTIDVVGTDHAPHTVANKAKTFDCASPGMTGLEQALAVVMETMVNTGRMEWATVVERMSAAPARIGRIAGQGRPLDVGEPGNVVLIDPSTRAVVDRENTASKGRNNPYHGLELPDPIVATVWAGRITHRR